MKASKVVLDPAEARINHAPSFDRRRDATLDLTDLGQSALEPLSEPKALS
jgi:hypothetical protein